MDLQIWPLVHRQPRPLAEIEKFMGGPRDYFDERLLLFCRGDSSLESPAAVSLTNRFMRSSDHGAETFDSFFGCVHLLE